MKILIVYYSRTGLTKKVAQRLAVELDAATEELIDKKDRAGALGYLLSGREAMQKKIADIEPLKLDPASYDLIIIGTPTWAYTMSCAVRAYLTEQRDRFKQVAFFATHGSDGGARAVKFMEELSGKKALASLIVTSKEAVKGIYQEKLRQFIEELKDKQESL